MTRLSDYWACWNCVNGFDCEAYCEEMGLEFSRTGVCPSYEDVEDCNELDEEEG